MIVRDFMTAAPHTIGAEQPLARAHAFMREHRVRHLPVLHGGKLVGLVSQRDLYFIETLSGVDVNKVRVEEAMSTPVYTVESRADLRRVAAEMAKHHYGAAVVLEDGQVAGIFTTTDALTALAI